MLTGTGKTNTGRMLILLGVERENIARLIGGRPIIVTPENHAIPADMEICIFFGETAKDLEETLKKAGVDAGKIIDRRDEGPRSS